MRVLGFGSDSRSKNTVWDDATVRNDATKVRDDATKVRDDETRVRGSYKRFSTIIVI